MADQTDTLPADDSALPQGAQNTMRNMGLDDAPKAVKAGPVYKVVGDSKVPVSKYHGSVWKKRKELGVKLLKNNISAWMEAIAYHDYDQQGHRNPSDGSVSGNTMVRRRVNDMNSETENVVFANVATMIPSLYTKNPDCEITATSTANDKAADQLEMLVNALFARKIAPGVNLKVKAKKGIVLALLTNEAWACVDWIKKADSSDKAIEDLNKIADSLANAKDAKEVETLEGQLMALDEKVAILGPSGLDVSLKNPWEVVVDPASRNDDFTDAQWMMYYEMLPWTYIRAIYGKKDDNGNWVSMYEPTHMLNATTTQGVDDQINNFTLFAGDETTDYQKFGYDDRESFDASKYCKVWYVWDKSTRRVYMYHDKAWDWPLWVWDDPLKLEGFFNLFRLNFHTAPEKTRSKGEVSYYLDQQDAINEINDEEARARLWVKRHILFNTKIIKDKTTLDKILKGVTEEAMGIDLPEGAKFEDVLGSLRPPSMAFKELFNTDRKMQAIDRISSVNDIQRGAQFKTNTTNKAVETYDSISNQRIDERVDSVEDWIGSIAWACAQLCLQYMQPDQVAAIIGDDKAAGWANIPAEEIRGKFDVQVVGGSAQKPTSDNKKKEAVQVGQVLGQFAQAAPSAVLKITLGLFQKAFDLDDIDWESIDQEAQQVLQQGNSQPGAGQPQPGAITPEIAQALQQLPPQAQQAFKEAVAKGVPAQAAIAEIQKQLGGGQQQQPQPTQQQ